MLKEISGKNHVNPKLWIPEPDEVASSTEVRQLMYLSGNMHKKSILDHRPRG